MYKKGLFIVTLFSVLVCTTKADDLAELLQDLAFQTACLGMYSAAQTGVYVTSRYDDPPDWYVPSMMANRFASMSGNMTRITTFYGVCFDYAQFAWDDIKRYQRAYNDAGMKGAQWYIAVANHSDPYTIILYTPVSPGSNNAVIMNGVYLRENSRHNVYAHDGASGHAWLWVQHNNGTWYWIDPTWTDNTGYVWWGKVENGREVQYYPDPDYCVATNYPRPSDPNRTQPEKTPRNPSPNTNPTQRENTRPSTPSFNPTYPSFIYLLGYNYTPEMPLGITLGFGGLYASFNTDYDSLSYYMDGGSSNKEEIMVYGYEFTAGYSFNLINNFLSLPVGIGVKQMWYYYYSGYYGGWRTTEYIELILEAGLQLFLMDSFYLSATYRLTGFYKSGFTIGAGLVFN